MKSKAQIGRLQMVIATLVVVGILLGVGFLILESLQGQLDNTAGSATNETQTVTDSGVAVDSATQTCFNTFAVTEARNASGGEVIGAGNYTTDALAGTVTAVGAQYNNTDWNITYTYNYGPDSCGGVEDTVEATKKIPTFLAIVVILLIVGILLALVFKSLPKAGPAV